MWHFWGGTYRPQSNAEKQQLRQTELHNREAKGQPVNVGDRVLLANR